MTPSTRFLSLALALAALGGLGEPREAAAAEAPRPIVVGEAVPAFEAQDAQGKTFSLAAARTISPEAARAAVSQALDALGAKGTAPEAELASLAVLRQGDALDPAKVAALGSSAGRAFGLQADAARVAGWTKVADVAAWIEQSAKAPIVFMAWSTSCPTCKMYEERVNALVASTGARLYLLAANYNDSDQAIAAAVAERHIPYPVLIDRNQAIADVLGARKTPHVFAVDEKGVLRYAGAIDSDPALTQAPEARTPWLGQALTALAAGRSFDVLLTTPKG